MNDTVPPLPEISKTLDDLPFTLPFEQPHSFVSLATSDSDTFSDHTPPSQPEDSASPRPNTTTEIMCPECPSTFKRPCDLKYIFDFLTVPLRLMMRSYQTNIMSKRKHEKYHNKPHPCSDASCARRFPDVKDRTRHELKEHPHLHPDRWEYYCKVSGCKMTPIPRRDNMARHVRKKHPTYTVEEVLGRRRARDDI